MQSPALLGQAFKHFRDEKGINQKEVGQSFMLDQTTISSIENGAAGTRMDTIFRLLAALELEMVIRPKQSLDSIEGW